MFDRLEWHLKVSWIILSLNSDVASELCRKIDFRDRKAVPDAGKLEIYFLSGAVLLYKLRRHKWQAFVGSTTSKKKIWS